MDFDMDNKRCVYNKEGESIQWVSRPFRSQPRPIAPHHARLA